MITLYVFMVAFVSYFIGIFVGRKQRVIATGVPSPQNPPPVPLSIKNVWGDYENIEFLPKPSFNHVSFRWQDSVIGFGKGSDCCAVILLYGDHPVLYLFNREGEMFEGRGAFFESIADIADKIRTAKPFLPGLTAL